MDTLTYWIREFKTGAEQYGMMELDAKDSKEIYDLLSELKGIKTRGKNG